jgi:hypothetical protein
VKSSNLAILVAIAAIALPTLSKAAGPKIHIPDFSHLRSTAVDSTDITVGRPLLSLAQHFMDKDNPDDAEGLAVLKGLKSVTVKSFTFDHDDAYSKADVDSVRKQFAAPGWSALVQVHKRDPQEDVDVFICTEDGKPTGLAVIASEAREFTIVNIVGEIDIDKLGKLEGQFGIPQVSQNQ